MTKRIQNPPTLAMRLNNADKTALRELSKALNRSQTDTVRVLVQEARRNLPEVKRASTAYPLPKKTGRPKNR